MHLVKAQALDPEAYPVLCGLYGLRTSFFMIIPSGIVSPWLSSSAHPESTMSTNFALIIYTLYNLLLQL